MSVFAYCRGFAAHSSRSLLVVSVLNDLLSCSSVTQSATTAQVAAYTSSAAVYDEVMAWPEADKKAVAAQMAAMSFADLYQLLERQVSDQRVTIDGLEIAGARQALVANRAKLLALDQRFKTLGALQAYYHIDLASITPAEYRAGIKSMVEESRQPVTSLALGNCGSSCPNPDPVPEPEYVAVHNSVCDPQHDMYRNTWGATTVAIAKAITLAKQNVNSDAAVPKENQFSVGTTSLIAFTFSNSATVHLGPKTPPPATIPAVAGSGNYTAQCYELPDPFDHSYYYDLPAPRVAVTATTATQ